jgi:hypothetical protein
MFKLLETKKARSLKCDFTGCIIDPPPEFHCSSGGGNVFSFLEDYVSPCFSKLIPGAHILLRPINPDDVMKYILLFGKLNMPLKAALPQMEDSYFKWLLFQKLGPGKMPKIDPKKTFPHRLPYHSRTELENQIFSDSIYRYSETQNVLRPLVKMICPKPKESNILVPFFGAGVAIAACEALNINSVGFDFSGDEDTDNEYARKVIAALTAMPIE